MMGMRSVLLTVFLLGAATIAALELPLDGSDVVGRHGVATVQDGDTLANVAQRHGLGFLEIVLANPDVDPIMPEVGTTVRLPLEFVLPDAPREGIVINLAERRLYYFPPGSDTVVTYPVGIGRDAFPTPLGTTRITAHIPNPSWTPTPSIRAEHLARGEVLPSIVPPGPDNPLGSFALLLELPGYLIHGTPKPAGVGQRVSHGCIRLYDDDVLALAERTPNGTVVRIVDQPFKVGARDGMLYAEFHRASGGGSLTAAVGLLLAAADRSGATVDWRQFDLLVARADGRPAAVSFTLTAAGEASLTGD